MSEKHGNGGTPQWTKGAIAQKQQQQHAPGQQLFEHPVGALAPPTVLYGGGAVTHSHLYAPARFQPPPLHHHASAPPAPPLSHAPTSVFTSLGAAPTIHTSNVPAPSGFVPPPFPPTAAVTSVLTPNPYAIASGSNVNPFGLDQFPHLNPQQQLELSKLVTAMNTAAAVSLASTASGEAVMAPMPLTTNAGGPPPPAAVSAPVPLTQQTQASVRQHAELPAGSGAINASLAEAVLSTISVPGHSNESNNNTQIHGRLTGVGAKLPDAEKMRRLQQTAEGGVSEQAKQQIVQILDQVSTLKPTERMLLYLRLPTETPETDPLRHPQNPLGTRSEINHTINWVRSHLEHDPQVSIPKQDVYNDYTTYCDRLNIKPLSTADFGKVMKQVFPGIRPRRLGTRGHSRYCYAAMRKTTKLGTPQLPELGGTGDIASKDTGAAEYSNPHAPMNCVDNESWEIIKGWAENLMNVKLEDAKDLATRIKSNSSNTSLSPAAGSTRTNTTHKKYTPREPKEKRTFVDMGPLKKRRKKKRKGSSSSESSCAKTEPQPQPEHNNNDSKSTSTTSLGLRAPSAESPAAQELEMLPVKEEFLDSPSFQIKHEIKQSPTANNMSSYTAQQEMMPINLAPEQRTVLAKAPPAGVNFAHMNHTTARAPHLSAVKNLTQKIMEISSTSSASPPLHSPLLVTDQQSIKEEIEDDYISTNIFCKKVRKAQQTKGFWQNSPTPPAPAGSHIVVPIITSTASTPPMSEASVGGGGGSSVIAAPASEAHYLMGPPTLTSSSASISPSSGLMDNSLARVSSRNMLQLRAKKQQATHDDDSELPEDLGLPRERVISICNMDKHELDDYFMSDEEESQDQDTELLQYFQTGDAEEKLNSLDAVKLRNPTANQAPKSLAGNNETAARAHMSGVLANANAYRTKGGASELVSARTPTTSGCGGAVRNVTSMLTTPATVGSASASLALMSQKHQKQQQKNAPSASNKRKISFNTQSLISNGNVAPARKNCIFLPISPNINSSTEATKHAANGSGERYVAAGGGLFASPGLKHMRPKPALVKQQSLDSDSSDPMIGQSSRRRRSYVSSGPNISASAPPSPSQIYSNKHQQQLFSNQWPPLVGGNNDVPSNAINLLNEQNSLDLDLFGAAASANVDYAHGSLNLDDFQLNTLNETQRSQSVPLSQLQRIHSPTYNRSFPANFSACTSMAQTPVPPEFVDSTHAFSENSSSQHSVHHAPEPSAANIAMTLDTKSMLDDLDFNDFVTEFNNKLPDIGQASNAATTTCSSTGSSSGYSSGGTCANFGTNNGFIGIGGGIVSRSVPSTPLPHHQYNLTGNANFYRRRANNDDIRLSPIGAIVATSGISAFRSTANTKYCTSQSARTIYDISKSMPTTPITTPCFSYSPTEVTRDFLINGNTVDSTTSFVGVGSENLINNGSGLGLTTGTGDGLDMDLVNLNADTLIDDSGVSVEAFPATTPISSDAESIMVGADILENL